MVFPVKVQRLALARQSRQDGYGSWCAGCGESLDRQKKHYVARIELKDGGRKNANNCVVVCRVCFAKINNPGDAEMSVATLPYSKVAPPKWESGKRK